MSRRDGPLGPEVMQPQRLKLEDEFALNGRGEAPPFHRGEVKIEYMGKHEIRSLIPQRDHGIDLGRAASGDVACRQRHEHQQDCNRGEGDRVGGGDAEKHG